MANNRIEWIDFSRCIAILCVLLCHCIEIFYKFDASLIQQFSLPSKIFACSTLTLGRLGVPLFLMITGFLLLDRVYDNERTLKFWNRNVKQLVICAVFWAIVGELFLIFIMHQNVALEDFIFGVLFLKPLNLAYFWYMPMIIGMYILIPFVAKALKDYDLDVIVKPTIFFAILVYLLPFLIEILNFSGFNDLSVQLSLGFSGGTYGIYIVMGYIIKKGYFKNIKTCWMALAFVISFITFIFLELYFFDMGYNLHIYYESPFVFICAICLFEIFSRLEKIRFYDIIYRISLYSFGIYVVHDIFRVSFARFFQDLAMNNSVKFILLYVLVLAFSLITVMVISRIPKVGKYILYLK